MKRAVLVVAILGVASPAVADPTPLTLDDAQAEAREHAPELSVVGAAVEGAVGRAAVAGRWLTHDPVTTLHYDEGGDRAFAVGIDWTIDLSSSWRPRRAAAKAEVAVAEADRDAGLADLDARVALTFAELADAQRRLARSERLVALHELAADAAERQRTGGGGTQIDADAAALDLRAAKVDRAGAKGDVATARIRLGRLLGREESDDLVVADDVEVGALPAEAELDDRVARDPRIRAATAEVEAATEAADAERRAARPDVTFGIELGHVGRDIPTGAFPSDAGLNAAWSEWEVSFQVSIPLPLFDHNREARADARARLLDAKASLALVRSDVEAEVDEVHAQLVAAAEAVEVAADVPEIVDREIALLDKAIRAGAIDLGDWAQQARRLEEVGRTYDDAILALRQARAAWERTNPQ